MAKPIQSQRVIILGGGMASLAAAYELVRDPKVAANFDITLYQIGWRLGGKCASGRNLSEPHGRIEEHGLHVWFGCYKHAFSMLRQCYSDLGRAYDMDALFDGKEDTPYMDDFEEWGVWPMHFDRKHGNVGITDSTTSMAQRLSLTLLYSVDTVAAFVQQAEVHINSVTLSSNAPIRLALKDLTTEANTLRTFLSDHANEDYSRPPVRDHVVDLARALRDRLLEPNLTSTFTSGPFRRWRIMATLGLTAATGTLVDDVLRKGYDSIDHKDMREWLRGHGAASEVLDSPPVRALYDLCFAYTDGIADWQHANFAAGAGLNTVYRIVTEFPDYVVYEMLAGMGEVVVAPLYEFLKRRNVRFEFFHRVTRLELAADRKSVASVHLARQVYLRKGAYCPLVAAPSPLGSGATMNVFPTEPDYDQIAQGDQVRGKNLESKWNQWEDVEKDRTLVAGERFDQIVLGISLDEVKNICEEFQTVADWQVMFQHMKTVQTCGVQLWCNRALPHLGWSLEPVPVDAGPEPLDVWADRTDLLRCERWPSPAPLSLQYLCGPLPGDWAAFPASDPTVPDRALQQTTDLTERWLSTQGYALWPAVATKYDFDWEILIDPRQGRGPARLAYQYLRPNIDPTERYVLSVKGSTAHRLAADGSHLINLFLCGDWTRSEWNAGCVEAAVITGRNAAQALANSIGVGIP